MNIISLKLAVTATWIALLLFVTGCSSVYVSQPIGEKPHVLDKADWEGYWLVHPELDKKPNMLHVKVVDANEGRLQLACFDEDATSLKIYEATVRESGSNGLLFITMPDPDGGEKLGRMLWGCLGRGEDLALVWVPDAEKFGKLVRDGKLRGKLVEKNVFLEPPTAEELKILVTDSRSLFYWGAPAICHRVAR